MWFQLKERLFYKFDLLISTLQEQELVQKEEQYQCSLQRIELIQEEKQNLVEELNKKDLSYGTNLHVYLC